MRKRSRLHAAPGLMTSSAEASVFAGAGDAGSVREVVKGLTTAWNHHDMEAFGRLFATDADFVNVAGMWWKGREAIRMNHGWAHGVIPRDTPGSPESDPHYGIFRHSTLRFTEISVRFLGKNVALAHAKTELSGDARTQAVRCTALLIVLTREGRRWVIAAAQNTELHRAVK